MAYRHRMVRMTAAKKRYRALFTLLTVASRVINELELKLRLIPIGKWPEQEARVTERLVLVRRLKRRWERELYGLDRIHKQCTGATHITQSHEGNSLGKDGTPVRLSAVGQSSGS